MTETGNVRYMLGYSDMTGSSYLKNYCPRLSFLPLGPQIPSSLDPKKASRTHFLHVDELRLQVCNLCVVFFRSCAYEYYLQLQLLPFCMFGFFSCARIETVKLDENSKLHVEIFPTKTKVH